jgi:hypothetical protein
MIRTGDTGLERQVALGHARLRVRDHLVDGAAARFF